VRRATADALEGLDEAAHQHAKRILIENDIVAAGMYPVAAIKDMLKQLGAVKRPDGMEDDDYEMLRRATATAALNIKMFMHNQGTGRTAVAQLGMLEWTILTEEKFSVLCERCVLHSNCQHSYQHCCCRFRYTMNNIHAEQHHDGDTAAKAYVVGWDDSHSEMVLVFRSADGSLLLVNVKCVWQVQGPACLSDEVGRSCCCVLCVVTAAPSPHSTGTQAERTHHHHPHPTPQELEQNGPTTTNPRGWEQFKPWFSAEDPTVLAKSLEPSCLNLDGVADITLPLGRTDGATDDPNPGLSHLGPHFGARVLEIATGGYGTLATGTWEYTTGRATALARKGGGCGVGTNCHFMLASSVCLDGKGTGALQPAIVFQNGTCIREPELALEREAASRGGPAWFRTAVTPGLLAEAYAKVRWCVPGVPALTRRKPANHRATHHH
jgi:hypothetical protein